MIGIKEITEITEAIRLVTSKMLVFMESDAPSRIVLDVKTGDMRDFLELQGALFEFAESMTEYGNILAQYLPVHNQLIVNSGILKPYNRRDE